MPIGFFLYVELKQRGKPSCSFIKRKDEHIVALTPSYLLLNNDALILTQEILIFFETKKNNFRLLVISP